MEYIDYKKEVNSMLSQISEIRRLLWSGREAKADKSITRKDESARFLGKSDGSQEYKSKT